MINIKRIILILGSLVSYNAYCGAIEESPSRWFVNTNQKTGIAFGDNDYSGNKVPFNMIIGRIYPSDKCEHKCDKIGGYILQVANKPNYNYISRNGKCSFTLIEKDKDIEIKNLREGCLKNPGLKKGDVEGIYTPRN